LRQDFHAVAMEARALARGGSSLMSRISGRAAELPYGLDLLFG
jgi:hypothetical protein